MLTRRPCRNEFVSFENFDEFKSLVHFFNRICDRQGRRGRLTSRRLFFILTKCQRFYYIETVNEIVGPGWNIVRVSGNVARLDLAFICSNDGFRFQSEMVLQPWLNDLDQKCVRLGQVRDMDDYDAVRGSGLVELLLVRCAPLHHRERLRLSDPILNNVCIFIRVGAVYDCILSCPSASCFIIFSHQRNRRRVPKSIGFLYKMNILRSNYGQYFVALLLQ